MLGFLRLHRPNEPRSRQAPLGCLLLMFIGCSPLKGNEDGEHSPVDALSPRYGTQPEFCTDPIVSVEDDAMWEVAGEHYRLSVGRSWSESEAEDLGRLIETAWPALEHYFDSPAAGPGGGLLEVLFFDSQEEWATSIEADGISVPESGGGLFHTSTNRAYLWRQPEVYTNQMLLLHEVAHQFHHLARDSHASTGWFVEGVAGYLQRHDWYEGCLRLGVVPTGSLGDAHESALDTLEAGNLDLESFVAGEGFTRPDAMALWAYLEEEHAEAFQDFRDEVDSGRSSEVVAFAELLDSPSTHEEAYEAWLLQHQEPIDLVYTGWKHLDQQHMAADASGTDSLVFAPLKQAPASFSMTVLPQDTVFSAGPVVSFEDWDHWSVVVAEQDGGVYALVNGDSAATWETLESIDAGEAIEVSYEVTDHTTDLDFNGQQQRFTHEQAGAAGLAVFNSSVIFEFDW
jgi:hypothetical protein